jgi:uncharacterized protein (TIGR00255 family)
MTGYGSCSVETELGRFEVTLKSLNHRFCSINIHVPDFFDAFELQIQDIIKNYINRGRVEYRLIWDYSGVLEPQPAVNEKVVETYLASLKEISDKYKLEGDIEISTISRLPGVFTFEKGVLPEQEKVWEPVSEITNTALGELMAMREKEGEAMKTSILEMLDQIERIQVAIEDLAPSRIDKARVRLQEKIEEILHGKGIDDERILMEVAILSEKWDISEELTRIRSHLAQFKKLLKTEEVLGRRLHFLLQELHREVNTVTSKANDVDISHLAVEGKEIIEQIREQAENIE